jgi:hypothetical protein
MTVNLHARTDFEKGDVGRVAGHVVSKVDDVSTGEGLVIALQSVKAGANGWFEKKQA